MNARISMEEKYSTLSIIYTDLDEKESIFEVNEECIKIFNISPDIYFKPNKPGEGRVIIEFRYNSRETHEYFEYIIADLNITIKEI